MLLNFDVPDALLRQFDEKIKALPSKKRRTVSRANVLRSFMKALTDGQLAVFLDGGRIRIVQASAISL